MIYLYIFLAVCLACFLFFRISETIRQRRRLARMRAVANDRHQRVPLPMTGSKVPYVNGEVLDQFDAINKMLSERNAAPIKPQPRPFKDPRTGNLTPEDAANLRSLAQSMGCEDSMPVWMAKEINTKAPRQIPRGAHSYPDLQ
jgi:hypothetical protein